MATRTDIINRIKALRAKAADQSATEAEALQAAEMAARLLARHDITPAELVEIEKSSAVDNGMRTGKELHPVLRVCGVRIGQLTETQAYCVGGEMRFVGLEEDVMMALYLSELFVGTAKRLWADYFPSIEGRRWAEVKAHREDLYTGFGARLSNRMEKMILARNEERKASSGNGSALVVIKKDLIASKMKEMGLELVKTKVSRNVRKSTGALGVGYDAAGSVSFERPLGSDAGAVTIAQGV